MNVTGALESEPTMSLANGGALRPIKLRPRTTVVAVAAAD